MNFKQSMTKVHCGIVGIQMHTTIDNVQVNIGLKWWGFKNFVDTF